LEDTESAQRARSRFLAAASHDLLQPVHALLLLTGLIRRVPEHKRDEVAQRIEVTAEAVDAMFRGLLDLARIDAGTLAAQRVSVPLP
ncbi:sensor histidine kinase, partial [Escherichia coli]|uniref:sensor histidine kinase n=1 Tax=Escherichia coli TaxID=562 RepID=UPI003CE499B8